MSGHLLMGLSIIVIGIGIALFLIRFSFIRKQPVLFVTVLLNPGLVGITAGLAFLVTPWLPSLTTPLVILTFGLLILSLPLIIIFLPRVMLEEMARKNQADQANQDDSNTDSSKPQGGDE